MAEVAIEKVHAAYRRVNNFRDLTTDLCLWINSYTRDVEGGILRDPCTDWRNGAHLYIIIEKLTGQKIQRRHERPINDRSRNENITAILDVIRRLNVEPLGDARWSAELLMEGEPLAAWGLLVAIAIRFQTEKDLAPDVYVAYQVETYSKPYTKNVDKPIRTTAIRKMLTPSKTIMDEMKANARAQYGPPFPRADLNSDLNVDAALRKELIAYCFEVLPNWTGEISEKSFKDGALVGAMLEKLTNKTIHSVTKRFLLKKAVEEGECMQNLRVLFEFMKHESISPGTCTQDDMYACVPGKVYDFIRAIKARFPIEAAPAAPTTPTLTVSEDDAELLLTRRSVQMAALQARAAEATEAAQGTVSQASALAGKRREFIHPDSRPPDNGEDVFDKLFAAEGFDRVRIDQVAEKLLAFVNKVLTPIEITVRSVAGLRDGVDLLLLAAILTKTFLDPSEYYYTPINSEEAATNVEIALTLLAEAGLTIAGCCTEDILDCEEKNILRLLYQTQRFFNLPTVTTSAASASST